MMAPLLTPNPPGSERTSQMLATVKCSNCNQPVPFTELGEHVCAPSPATTPKLPKPSLSAIATAALLPQRLQNRVPSPISTPAFHRSMASNASASSSAQKVQDSQLPPSIDRLRANTASPASASQPQAPSSLGGQGVNAKNDKPELPSFLRIGGRSPTRQGAKSPLGPGPGAIPPVNPRPRTTSNAASIPSARPNPPPMNPPRPPFAAPGEPMRKNSLPLPHPPPPPSFNPRSFTPQPETMRQNALPPSHPMNPPQLRPLPAPRGPPGPPVNHGPGAPPRVPYNEHDIDTKSGGEAGMAGVGRRGFHAAARAAMLVTNFPGRRMNPPQYLNTNVPRALDTPPLSAGSGYSSHSPSISPYPQSPLAPSPDRHNHISVGPTEPAQEDIVDPLAEVSRTSPVASLRMPFFDKVKNQHPATESNLESPVDTPSTAKPLPLPFPNPTPPPPPVPARESVASTSSLYSSAHPPSRSNSTATSTGTTRRALPNRPLSPASESGSDVGGLAYADSSDEEHEEHEDEDEVVVGDAQSIKGKSNPPPPLPLTQSILRSNSVASTNHVRFPSTSDRSDRSAMPIPTGRTSHSRNTSFSSASGDEESRKSNALAIAAALGLSRTPPSDYRRLGGPGSTMGGRSSRSGSGSSSGGRSAYSRSSSHGQALTQAATAPVEPVPAMPTGIMEKQMQTLLEDKTAVTFVDELAKAGLSKSKSTGSQRTFADKDQRPKPALAQRSNTVQVVQSAEPRAKSPPVQLPARPRTNSEKSVPAPLNVERKVKACLKCHNKIDGRRWVQVEFGVLCDGCWKNLYLPKCRRCNKPIERQAVSSSDGQLKGKYHRECFNCATCHQPFPDKSFYVFDGKPLCAYHYHEANNSLCAASFCRQPIEGPCAVSHTGERYHPEHMTCEHPGDPPCQAHLAEYWEVDGRMLCERHAHESTVGSDDEGEGKEEWVQSAKARKRVTRFIDLGAKLDDDEDEDLT